MDKKMNAVGNRRSTDKSGSMIREWIKVLWPIILVGAAAYHWMGSTEERLTNIGLQVNDISKRQIEFLTSIERLKTDVEYLKNDTVRRGEKSEFQADISPKG